MGQDEKNSFRVYLFRFTPESRRSRAVAALRICAISGCEQSQQTTLLFDHLVGAHEERFGDYKPDRLGGFEVDEQVQSYRQFDR
jgi:hypothetical protein